MRDGVLFDFDDTLVETTVYFNQARDEFAEIMAGLGFPVKEVLETLNRFDIRNVQLCGGFFKECFPKALGETYKHFCNIFKRNYNRTFMKELENLGWWVYDQPVRPIPGAEEVLDALYDNFPLFLVTKGDPVVQKERVEKSGMSHWFEKVYVLANKNVFSYRSIASERQIRPHASWVVGNSMKSDINPALRAGFRCVYVFNPHTWDYEDEEPVGGHISVDKLTDVLKVMGYDTFADKIY